MKNKNFGHTLLSVPDASLAVVLILVVLVLVVLVLIVLVLVLIVVHDSSSKRSFRGVAAMVAFPGFYDLSLSLKIKLAIKPLTTAAVIPPAVAFRPPVRIPRNPS